MSSAAHADEKGLSMSHKWISGTIAAFALAQVAVASGPTHFRANPAFNGSSLAGWHSVGQADWRVEKGEIVGTPRTPGGGWLVLERAYQDTGFFASFRCSNGCKTGVMLRAETVPEGMKGAFVSLNEGDLASYNLKLDAQGQEIAREPLRGGAGTTRIAPPATGARGGGGGRGAAAAPAGGGDGAAPAGRGGAVAAGRGAARGGGGGGGGGGYSGPAGAPVGLRAEEWNTVEVIVDAEVLRASLNAMGASGGGSTGIAGGVTGDGTKGFGPVALYAGGTGEVRFKEISVRDLAPKVEVAEETSSRFTMRRLSDFYYAWSATAADFNRDGVMDVAAGPFYYLGPSYTERREFTISQTFNPSNQYASGMINFAYDYTGDGWADILMTASRPIMLYVNPKGESRRWDSYSVVPSVSTEEVQFKDVDGDAKPEVVFGGGGVIAYAKPDPADPTRPWTVRAVSEKITVNAHGIGVGDINGDGRMDILQPSGWWEQPAANVTPGPWAFHPEYFGRGGAEISVYDVNGDGRNDVVTSIEGHGWGLSWFEQRRDREGTISFVEHEIMGNFSSQNAGDVVFSQPHASTIGDMDGDGIADLITGKRHYSHQESWSDPDPYGPAVLYVYRTVRDPKAPGGARFVPELIHNRSGVGSHLQVLDVNKDGALDILTSGTRGTFVFTAKPRATAKPAAR
jgi:hypothetical protein